MANASGSHGSVESGNSSFGSLDGLIVTLGVVSGVAGGTGSSQAVIIAGIAEAFAGALSMGAGEFISARSEAQVQRSEVQHEIDEMANAPEYEKRELAQIYQLDGMSPEDARLLVETLAATPKAYQTAMVGKELGIATLDPETVKIPEALTIAVSYLVGSFFPLIAYVFPAHLAGAARLTSADLHRAGHRRHHQRQAGQHEPLDERHRDRGGRRRVGRRWLPAGQPDSTPIRLLNPRRAQPGHVRECVGTWIRGWRGGLLSSRWSSGFQPAAAGASGAATLVAR